MLQQIFTVYDSKAEMYLTPFYQNTVNQARRVFSDIINNHEHQFSKNPEDYTLFHLGEYNDKSAQFNMLDTPASLQLGLEIVKIKTVPLELHKEMQTTLKEHIEELQDQTQEQVS